MPRPRHLLPALLLLLAARPAAAAPLPQEHAYQKKLRAYLATLKEEDLAVPALPPLAMPKEVPADVAYRAWVLTSGGGYGWPRFGEVRAPAKHFTLAWVEGGKEVRRPPVSAGNYARLTRWSFPFNPYRDNKALRRRDFVACAVELMMLDRLHEASPNGPANRSDFLGGTLIWLGHDYAACKDAVPPEARAAYEEGLKKLVRRLARWGPRRAMTDMDLFAPVGLHYCAEATGDPEVRRIADAYTRAMLADRRLFDPAGYFVDSGGFDASYNGISLYFATWAASATRSPHLVEALAKAYRLKAHLTLPEPDGSLFGPSHFSPRTSADAANDQWGWRFRDCAAAALTEEALPCARPPTPAEMAAAPAALLARFRSDLARPRPADAPVAWAERHWTMYPVFAEKYARPEFIKHYRKLEAEKSPKLVLPFARKESFVRTFGDRFVIAKRPRFGVVIHTGPVGGEDRGLKRPLGFGGGALSAFWTAESGSVILGRRRGIQGPNWDRLEEWPSWPTHAVSAVTAAGKLTTSARVRAPEVTTKATKDTASVVVRATLPDRGLGQGQVLAGKVEYERRFDVSDAGLSVRTSLRSDGKDRFREAHEVLPLFVRNGRAPAKGETFRVLYREGEAWRPVPADRTVKAARLRVERFGGAVEVELDRARPVKLSPAEWFDGYMSAATCRNVLIELLGPGGGPRPFEALEVSYRIVPAAGAAPAPRPGG